MYEEQKPLDDETIRLIEILGKERNENYNKITILEMETRKLYQRNEEIRKEIHSLTRVEYVIAVTPEQKERYDKELASDNWKKYIR